jgi:hypothetical protein
MTLEDAIQQVQSYARSLLRLSQDDHERAAQLALAGDLETADRVLASSAEGLRQAEAALLLADHAQRTGRGS